ncbi:RING-H2 finger protein ATL67-like [Phalaenopsis equestris]|uniref:RING-H2 finger protein ATL67-like n=1 Tax=Phalaenopsis equestris TaxID=78828 RepID=UPI0009E2D494|nr:RING-H2 finger protein ATL67-like [Phalaenopsis equestris]
MLGNISSAADSTPPPPPYVYNIGGLSTPVALGLIAVLVVFLITVFLTLFFCYHLTLIPHYQNPNPSPDQTLGAAPARVIFVMEGEYQAGRGVPGLDEAVISSYPEFSFSVNGGEEGLCSICLNEYKEGQMLKRMPECRHCFHIGCIDSWLRRHGTCPICRSTPAPPGLLATPMTDLSPLSQDAGERLRG